MAYEEFAYFYDELNTAANYNKLFSFINKMFKKHGLKQGIIADLGCGTGEITIKLAKKKYEVLAIDASWQMLSVLNDKISGAKYKNNILILNQDITNLDLYGTINGAVSTFDTFNHLQPQQLENAIKSAAFFMEKNALFIFDLNTLYKHAKVLANNTYKIDTLQAQCVWKNTYIEHENKTHIELNISYKIADENGETDFYEDFYEYVYSKQRITDICLQYGLQILDVYDGESFKALKDTSQRMIFVAQKLYTQEKE